MVKPSFIYGGEDFGLLPPRVNYGWLGNESNVNSPLSYSSRLHVSLLSTSFLQGMAQAWRNCSPRDSSRASLTSCPASSRLATPLTSGAARSYLAACTAVRILWPLWPLFTACFCIAPGRTSAARVGGRRRGCVGESGARPVRVGQRRGRRHGGHQRRRRAAPGHCALGIPGRRIAEDQRVDEQAVSEDARKHRPGVAAASECPQ